MMDEMDKLYKDMQELSRSSIRPRGATLSLLSERAPGIVFPNDFIFSIPKEGIPLGELAMRITKPRPASSKKVMIYYDLEAYNFTSLEERVTLLGGAYPSALPYPANWDKAESIDPPKHPPSKLCLALIQRLQGE